MKAHGSPLTAHTADGSRLTVPGSTAQHLLRLRLIVVGLLLLFVALGVGAQSADPERAVIARALHDVSRALQAGNAATFLAAFDRQEFTEYPQLETNIVVLTRQSQIASSIKIAAIEADGEVFSAEVDWVLQLSPASALGDIETRRQLIKLRLRKAKKKWKVVALEPVEFFEPM